jgi:hypothetical protein
MGTGSKDEGGSSDFEVDSSEPVGLSATAFGRSSNLRPRTPRAPGHQQAVELVSSARRHLREGRTKDAKDLFRQAADLERQVLRRVTAQPERSLVAEFGARAALQGGMFILARELARKGLSEASAPMQWSLHRVAIEAEILELLEEFKHGWEIPWEPVDENESRIVVTSRSGRRFAFDIDPEAPCVTEKRASPDQVAFIIPAPRPSRAELEDAVARWLPPKRRAQPLLEQRGLMDHFLLDLVPA